MVKKYTLKQLNLQDSVLKAQLFLPSDLFYFDGHFDELPILPGITQTHWAIQLACENFDIQEKFSGIDNIKFSRIINPDQTVNLTVTYNNDKNFIEFSYESALGLHSSGKVRFA